MERPHLRSECHASSRAAPDSRSAFEYSAVLYFSRVLPDNWYSHCTGVGGRMPVVIRALTSSRISPPHSGPPCAPRCGDQLKANDGVFGRKTNGTYGIVARMGADSTDHTAQHGRIFSTDPKVSDTVEFQSPEL